MALSLGGLGAGTLPARVTTATQRVYGATLLCALAGITDGRRRTSPPVAPVAAAAAALPVLRRLL